MNRINTRLYLICTNSRSFHISSFYNGQAKVMKKLMGEGKRKNFKYHNSLLVSTPSTFTAGAHEGKKSSNSKRVNVLNKLFMRYITDLMSTGECSTAFVGHGIEISRVQVTADFSCVRIYWSSHSEHDLIEDILNKNVGILRHELAQLKVVGVVPRLLFVKDRQIAGMTEVNKLLAEADYGDDYVPVDLASKIKTELQLNTNSDPYIRKINDSEEGDECDDLPMMPNNIFGLNYAKMKEEIENATRKSKGLCRINSAEETTSSAWRDVKPISEQDEREAFTEFLQKQQIMKSKMQKADKKHIANLERVEDEWIPQHEEYAVAEENDFIDEEGFSK